MIFVDRRIGSKDLVKPLIAAGFAAELTDLEYADVAFQGLGPKGSTLDIGIELKALSDLVSSLRTGRLAGHQLPGLRESYGDYAWLVVEGAWRADESGAACCYQGPRRGWQPIPGKMTASELEKQVLTLELCGGLHVRYTNSRSDTVRFIGNLFRWWTDQPLDAHSSHLAVHQAPTLVPISESRQAFMRLPGIGVKVSAAVDAAFDSSLRKACKATVGEWANIPIESGDGKVRRFGDAAATKVDRFLEGI